MFNNEVLIDCKDKDRLVEILKEADDILKKYPHEAQAGFNTVTIMSRAKNSVENAFAWCRSLCTKDM